jgi:hypothetical protein
MPVEIIELEEMTMVDFNDDALEQGSGINAIAGTLDYSINVCGPGCIS